MLSVIPLLIVPLAFYNFFVFVEPTPFATALFAVPMASGVPWVFTLGDALITVAVICLFVEILKATRTGTISILDHALSTLVFIACLLEFVLVAEAATSTFFILVLIVLFDVVAGYSITIRAARRDFAVGSGSSV